MPIIYHLSVFQSVSYHYMFVVSKALFYICRDTYFSTLFGVCPTFRSRITAIILFFIFYVDS